MSASSESLKRKRSLNWDEAEKELLMCLIRGKMSVINNKTVDANTNKQKKKAWNEIHQSFNNLTVSKPRDVAQLQVQWKAIKMDAKKWLSAHKRIISGTGVGPKPPSPLPEDLSLMEMIPCKFEVADSIHDSNSIAESQNQDHIRYSAFSAADFVEVEVIDDPSPSASIAATEPADIPAEPNDNQIAAAGTTIVKVKTKNKFRNENGYRQRLFDATLKDREEQRRQRRLEHEQLLRHREEYHMLRMQHQREEHEATMRTLKQREEYLKHEKTS